MFSTPESLKRRTGQFGVSRFPYLQQLVCEYEDSSCSDEHKLQILANLANFAYDPINYDYIRQLNIIHLFMDCLKMNIEGYINENNSEQQQFLEYCIGGLCNLCLDNKNKLLILNDDCVLLSIIKCLCSNSINIVLNSMCLLMFLITDESKDKICSTQVIECLKQYKQSNDQRLANMAKVFLNEYCTEQNKMSST
ncbi:unnamed protein product [Didymodactylos carnosus]|uniref:Armadillo repeat-containing protein 7 n=1 Tax=Didymodactylos carnosus TaxID=1234261 RepID=A0A814CXZ8_9BILA|nr:unnamed protein product [Didymodactylos carnosus]CAF3723542.1 unnamed protein product [Didymodactylos carnosus]